MAVYETTQGWGVDYRDDFGHRRRPAMPGREAPPFWAVRPPSLGRKNRTAHPPAGSFFW